MFAFCNVVLKFRKYTLNYNEIHAKRTGKNEMKNTKQTTPKSKSISWIGTQVMVTTLCLYLYVLIMAYTPAIFLNLINIFCETCELKCSLCCKVVVFLHANFIWQLYLWVWSFYRASFVSWHLLCRYYLRLMWLMKDILLKTVAHFIDALF